jgi:hypothetical protein
MSGALGIGLTALDYGIQEARNDRAYSQERGLMNQQYGNQRRLNEQGQQLQLDTWRKTNYKAQLEMMKQAGLNPALMYKSAGQGGSLGTQGGGSASGGSAPQQPKLDISTIMSAKLMDAQAKKLEAETTKLKGIDTQEGEGRLRGIEQDILKKVEETSNLKTQGEILSFEKDVADARADRAKNGGTLPGDVIGNLLKIAGLDPVNNEDHKKLLMGLFGVKFVTDIIGKLASAYGSAKMGGLGKTTVKAGGTKGNSKLLGDIVKNKYIPEGDKKKIIDAINGN